MAKLQQNLINGSCWLVIPAAIIRSKGWRKGDEFIIVDEPNGIKFTRGEIQTSRKPSRKQPLCPPVPMPPITMADFYDSVFGEDDNK
ncbi:hypothetical protein EO95_03190 [Methanosarcina sp. 1.H.T.1A.1]|jgi:hypothetical protein|nr:hypothetical protein EO95_03190 [Methanosarcina sp. 1.H.T.1A.1]